ncbi:MAG: hypothetical protein ABFQ65_04180 [Nanoarchaeota archaeon]
MNNKITISIFVVLILISFVIATTPQAYPETFLLEKFTKDNILIMYGQNTSGAFVPMQEGVL